MFHHDINLCHYILYTSRRACSDDFYIGELDHVVIAD